MFTKIAYYITRSKVAKVNIARQKQFLNWNKIEKIALFIDDKETINKNEIDKFVEGLKKYVEVFYLELKSKQAAYGDWKCITKTDKNIFGLPKSSILYEVKSKKMDLVINASTSYPFFSADLVSHINAPFKCGNVDLFGELDLIVERKESQNLILYLQEVQKYLEMIRTE